MSPLAWFNIEIIGLVTPILNPNVLKPVIPNNPNPTSVCIPQVCQLYDAVLAKYGSVFRVETNGQGFMFATTFQTKKLATYMQTTNICKAAIELVNSFSSFESAHMENISLELHSAVHMGPIVAGG